MAGERRKVRQLTAKLLREAIDQSSVAGKTGKTPTLKDAKVFASFQPDVVLDQDSKFDLRHPVIMLATPSQRALDEARPVTMPQGVEVTLIIWAVVAGQTYDDVDDMIDGLHHDIEQSLFGDLYKVTWNKAGENNPALTWLGHFGEQNVSAHALNMEALDADGRKDFCYGGFVTTLEIRLPWCPPKNSLGDAIEIQTTIQAHDQGVKANVHSDTGSPFNPGIVLKSDN